MTRIGSLAQSDSDGPGDPGRSQTRDSVRVCMPTVETVSRHAQSESAADAKIPSRQHAGFRFGSLICGISGDALRVGAGLRGQDSEGAPSRRSPIPGDAAGSDEPPTVECPGGNVTKDVIVYRRMGDSDELVHMSGAVSQEWTL
jgi:hypothetical protein